MKIVCKWLKDNRVLVNPDGQVLPCCYLANPIWGIKQNFKGGEAGRHSDGGKGVDSDGNPLSVVYNQFGKGGKSAMEEYNNDKEKYNIHNNDMKDILKGKWFTKTLPDSWKDETKTISQCRKWCGEE